MWTKSCYSIYYPAELPTLSVCESVRLTSPYAVTPYFQFLLLPNSKQLSVEDTRKITEIKLLSNESPILQYVMDIKQRCKNNPESICLVFFCSAYAGNRQKHLWAKQCSEKMLFRATHRRVLQQRKTCGV